MPLLLLTLQRNYRWYFVGDMLFTDGFIDEKLKKLVKLHMVFCRLYEKLLERNTDVKKRVGFFGALCPSINPSIYLLLMDSPTYKKLPTRVFLTCCFRS
jgi:hypothetical protein